VTVLAATGLKREAALIAADGVNAVVSGGRADLLEQRLRAASPGVTAIVSLGIGGALAEGLQPGDWVVATKVVSQAAEWPTDLAWTTTLATALKASTGAILGADAMVLKAADKRAARARTGALAVDMESHVAARVAQALGVPFAAARVVSDAADRDLPRAVTVGMRPDGGMALGPVLLSLLANPLQLPALIRAGRDAEVAFRALGAHPLGSIVSSAHPREGGGPS
jgi:hopanoid-associated phosphorylase